MRIAVAGALTRGIIDWKEAGKNTRNGRDAPIMVIRRYSTPKKHNDGDLRGGNSRTDARLSVLSRRETNIHPGVRSE